MTDFVSIYADGDSGKVVTVTEAFAEGIGATVLDTPATDRSGRPLPARDLPEKPKKASGKSGGSTSSPSGDAGTN